MKMTGHLTPRGRVSGSLSSITLTGEVTFPSVASVEQYKGDYVFAPASVPQVIDIQGKQATEDIIIEAIPSNYGLVEWDGSVLKVS